MDQAEQKAIAEYNKMMGNEKRVSQLTESELKQLVREACKQAIDELVFINTTGKSAYQFDLIPPVKL